MKQGGAVEDRVLLGLNFTPAMVENARRDDRMLFLDMDLTRRCNLRCIYCDRTPDRKSEEGKTELTTDERLRLIHEAHQLGAWTVGFVGAGEPMLDPDIWPILTAVHSLGMVPLVYTSGWDIHDPGIIDRLSGLGVSVMLKYNSPDERRSDRLAGVRGYGSHVKRVLEWLLERGFHTASPTRLGINVVVTDRSEREPFLDLFRWCRQNNVYMHGQSLIPEGKGDREDLVLSRSDALTLLADVARIDADEYGLCYDVVPPIVGGYRCRKVNIGMFVNVFGETWDCNGSGQLLSGSLAPLSEIWRSQRAAAVRARLQEGYCLLRERWWRQSEDGLPEGDDGCPDC